MDASAAGGGTAGGGSASAEKRERKQTVFTRPEEGFYELKTPSTRTSTVKNVKSKGKSKGKSRGKNGSGGSRRGVNTSANFFEFWVLCYILHVMINRSKPNPIDVSQMMNDVSDAIKTEVDETEINFEGITIYFPNKEKIESFMADWEKKQSLQKVTEFITHWCRNPTGLYEGVSKETDNVAALYIACHPPEVVRTLLDLEDPKGKNATADVTILDKNGNIFGISVKQSDDPEKVSTSLPFANLSASIVFERIGLREASRELLAKVDEIITEWMMQNPDESSKYSREVFAKKDSEFSSYARALTVNDLITKYPEAPFAIISKALLDVNAQKEFLKEIVNIWHQQLYPGTSVCVGFGTCVTSINNVTPYENCAKLFTSKSLYIGHDAAKLFYLVFSPYFDNATGEYKYDIILIECGRRGSPNYKFILSFLYSSNISNSLPMAGMKGIPADACAFFNDLIHKFMENPKYCGIKKARTEGGSRKRKSLSRRNTRRSNKN